MMPINTNAKQNEGGKWLGWPVTSYGPVCHCLTNNYTSQDINEIIPFSRIVKSKTLFFGQIQ